jgi:uncharacterized membrane protein YhfC
MTPLTISFVVSILIQLVLPIGLGVLILRRYRTHWQLLAAGVMAYLVYQVLVSTIFQAIGETAFYTTQILPLAPVTGAILIGFVSAIIEQLIRAGSFWFVRNSVRTWGGGLTVSVGYAGIESALIGFQLLLTLIFALTYTPGAQGTSLTPEETASLQSQVAAFWQLPWYLPLAAGLQRMAVLVMQSTLGLMIWLVVSRRMWVWLGAALAWQTAMNAISAILSASMPDWATVVLYVLIGVVNGAILILLYRKTGAAQEELPPQAPAKVSKKPVKSK